MSDKLKSIFYTIFTFLCLIVFVLLTFGTLKPVAGYFTPNQIVFVQLKDTVSLKPPQDTVVDVKNKRALFIGDSHTSGYGWGWQDILCKKTKMQFLNTAVGGKRTAWMISKLNENKKGGWDYCFIYGGANDCAASIKPITAYRNVQRMVDTCIKYHMKPVVITGTDPSVTFTGTAPEWKDYTWKKLLFQKYLVDSLKRASLVDVRFIPRSDCADFVCHMKPSGHKKVADAVLKKMKFKVYP